MKYSFTHDPFVSAISSSRHEDIVTTDVAYMKRTRIAIGSTCIDDIVCIGYKDYTIYCTSPYMYKF